MAYSGDHTSQENKSKSTEKDQKPKPPFPGAGVLCCMGASLALSFQALVVKMVTSVGAIQMSTARCLVQFVALLPLASFGRFSGDGDLTGSRPLFKYLLLRGLLGSFADALLFQAITILSPGNAVSVMFTVVVFTALLGRLCLGEAYTPVDGLLSVTTLLGVLLIAQPSWIFGSSGDEFDFYKAVGIACALGAAVLIALAYVVLRNIVNRTPTVLNVIYYSVVGFVVTLALTPVTDQFRLPCSSDLGYLLLIGVLGIAGQLLLTVALQYERATTVAVLRSCQIVVVFILQVVVLEDIPSVLSLAGSAVILVTVTLMTLRKIWNSRTAGKKQGTI